MLNAIKTQEITTKRIAQEKYYNQYIVMVITDTVDNGDNDKGYVIYTADDKRDFRQIPQEECKGRNIALTLGVSAEPYPLLGNVVYYD